MHSVHHCLLIHSATHMVGNMDWLAWLKPVKHKQKLAGKIFPNLIDFEAQLKRKPRNSTMCE